MSLQNTTPVPNRLFDLALSTLKEVELKVLLVIIRKTLGWVEEGNRRQRKKIARISIQSFAMNTGCSKRGISTALDALITKGLIMVFDQDGNKVADSDERKGKYHLYFTSHIAVWSPYPLKAKFVLQPAQNLLNTIKETEQKKGTDISQSSALAQSPFHINRALTKYMQ